MVTRFARLGLLAALTATGLPILAQKKPAPAVAAKPGPNKAPAKAPVKPPQKPAPVTPQATAPAAAGAEERELKKVPEPKSAKLPKANYENEDISKNESRGTVTFAMSAGLYNFTNKVENPQTNVVRTYSLQPIEYTTLLGFDLAIRIGKDRDKEKHHDSSSGFSYYRSNRGIFTDLELGSKFQRTEDKPVKFYYTDSALGGGDIPVDLGFDPATTPATSTQIINQNRAGITSQVRNAVGAKAAEVTMFYANAYYHFTPMNFLFNWGSTFRWFDSSIGPSLRVWYYRDYSDPVRLTTRNDDWTYATFMIVYRQYIQFHPLVRLRTHFYFPALSFFTELARSPRFNEKEYIVNAALEFYALRVGSVGAILSVGYEGHWWVANPYSADKSVRDGFSPAVDARNAGFEHKTRSSWEAFASIAFEFRLGDESAAASASARPEILQTPVPVDAKPAQKKPKPR